MSKEQLDIADMQCWVFRMAQKKWNISGKECSELFQKYDILGFIRNCYGIISKENISYEQAMLKFTDSKIYDALFDYDTEIWKESSVYLLDLYLAYCLKN